MPGWSLYKKWGRQLLGFADKEIDEIADKCFGHDAGRYDVDALRRSVWVVYSRHGLKGLRYFVLHHYMDRL